MIRLKHIVTWQRLYAIAIWSISCALALVIITWSATDNSLVFYSTAAHTHRNIGGYMGALIAGCLWYIFGIGALLLPVLGFYLGWLFWASAWGKEWDRVSASLAAMVLFCIAAQELQFGAFKHQMVHGGLVGLLGSLSLIHI